MLSILEISSITITIRPCVLQVATIGTYYLSITITIPSITITIRPYVLLVAIIGTYYLGIRGVLKEFE